MDETFVPRQGRTFFVTVLITYGVRTVLSNMQNAIMYSYNTPSSFFFPKIYLIANNWDMYRESRVQDTSGKRRRNQFQGLINSCYTHQEEEKSIEYDISAVNASTDRYSNKTTNDPAGRKKGVTSRPARRCDHIQIRLNHAQPPNEV